MKFIYPIVTVALLIVALSAAHADDAAVRKELEAQYRKLAAAEMDSSIRDIQKLLTPDFTWKRLKGAPLNRDQTGSYLRTALASAHVIKMDVAFKSLAVKGSDAVANVTATTVSLGVDPTGKIVKKGLRVRTTSIAPSKDTWTKTAQGWQLKSAEDLPGGKTNTVPNNDVIPTGPPPVTVPGQAPRPAPGRKR